MDLFHRIKRLLRPGLAGAFPARDRALPLEHPILGALAPDPRFADCLVGQVAHGDANLGIRLSPDGKPMEQTLSLMVDAVRSLSLLDQKCRRLIARNALDGYNTDWRFGQRALPGGGTEAFERPMLTEDAFCAKLQLQSLEATGDSLLTFWYGDDDLFWGHGFSVDAFDGVRFQDTHVSMVG